MENEFRKLPSIEKVLSDDRIKAGLEGYPHDLRVNIIRQKIEEAQQSIKKGNKAPSIEEIIASVLHYLNNLGTVNLRPVINATGVILHTNLGRAPLSRETIEAMEKASRGYCNLEFDMETGEGMSIYMPVK